LSSAVIASAVEPGTHVIGLGFNDLRTTSGMVWVMFLGRSVVTSGW